MLTEFDERIVVFSGFSEDFRGFDQYVGRCRGGGIHLHVYGMGGYRGCSGCQYRPGCRESAHAAGEQAEL